MGILFGSKPKGARKGGVVVKNTEQRNTTEYPPFKLLMIGDPGVSSHSPCHCNDQFEIQKRARNSIKRRDIVKQNFE